MNKYVENLKHFLEQQAPNFGYDDADSILEMLYYYYTEANPVDNAVIRCQFTAHENTVRHLSLAEQNALFHITAELCTTYERQAFLDGIHVGLRLFAELNAPLE